MINAWKKYNKKRMKLRRMGESEKKIKANIHKFYILFSRGFETGNFFFRAIGSALEGTHTMKVSEHVGR